LGLSWVERIAHQDFTFYLFCWETSGFLGVNGEEMGELVGDGNEEVLQAVAMGGRGGDLDGDEIRSREVLLREKMKWVEKKNEKEIKIESIEAWGS
jgi:hypothetical protein